MGGNIRNIVRRNLKHASFGVRLVPEGVVRPTPKSEIKEVPKETEVVGKHSPKGEAKKVNLADQKTKQDASKQTPKVKPNKQETTDKPGKVKDPEKK